MNSDIRQIFDAIVSAIGEGILTINPDKMEEGLRDCPGASRITAGVKDFGWVSLIVAEDGARIVTSKPGKTLMLTENIN